MREKEYRYYNSKNEGIPSVTEVVGIIAKPYLIRWANSLGFRKIKYEEESKYHTDIGELAHKLNEVFITTNNTEAVAQAFLENPLPYENKLKALTSFKSFKNWYDEYQGRIEPIHNEYRIVTEKYAGTIDFICKIDGEMTIIDFKTSKSISMDYLIQVIAYYQLCKEEGIEISQVGILRQDKNSVSYDFVLYKVEDLINDGYLDLFNNLLDIYYNYERLSILFKGGN